MKESLSSVIPIARPLISLVEKATDNSLYKAAESRDIKTIEFLIKIGVNVNCHTNYEGYESPLELAVGRGYVDIVKLLIAGGANVNRVNSGHWSPLFFAVTFRQIEIVELLIDEGADVNQLSDISDETPLTHAINIGFLGAVSLLICKGAKVDRVIRNGNNHLMLAVVKGYAEIAKLLIEKGANLNQVNNRGDTPLKLALARPDMTEVAVKIMLYQPAIPENIDQTTDNFKRAKEMADQTVLRELFLSFASGRHQRLGSNNTMRMLCDDVVGIIAEKLASGGSPSNEAKEAVAQNLIEARIAMTSNV